MLIFWGKSYSFKKYVRNSGKLDILYGKFEFASWDIKHYDSVYSHSSGLVTWVRNKSCQPDLRFLKQTDVAGGTTTLQLGSDVVDLDSSDSQIDVIFNIWWRHIREMCGVKVYNSQPAGHALFTARSFFLIYRTWVLHTVSEDFLNFLNGKAHFKSFSQKTSICGYAVST